MLSVSINFNASVFRVIVVMLSVDVMGIVMLTAIRLSVVMLNDVAPFSPPLMHWLRLKMHFR
jgi:hypothetical protein